MIKSSIEKFILVTCIAAFCMAPCATEINEHRWKRIQAKNCGLNYDILVDNIRRLMPGRGPYETDEHRGWTDFEYPLAIYKDGKQCFHHRPLNANHPEYSYAQDQISPMFSVTKSLGAIMTNMAIYYIDQYIDALYYQQVFNPMYNMYKLNDYTYQLIQGNEFYMLRKLSLNQSPYNWIAWANLDRNLFLDQPTHRNASAKHHLAMMTSRDPEVEDEILHDRDLVPQYRYDTVGNRGLNYVGFMVDQAFKQFHADLPKPMFYRDKAPASIFHFWNDYVKRELSLSDDSRWTLINDENFDAFWENYVKGFFLRFVISGFEDFVNEQDPIARFILRLLTTGIINNIEDIADLVAEQIPEELKRNLIESAKHQILFGYSWQATLDDAAKLSQLLIDGGLVKKPFGFKKRLLSEAMVDEMIHASLPEINQNMGQSVRVGAPEKRLLDCAPVDRKQLGQGYDVGTFFFLGSFGQVVMGHPGLGITVVMKDASSDRNRSLKLPWDRIVVPALVAENEDFRSIEDFCEAYAGNQYAPYRSP